MLHVGVQVTFTYSTYSFNRFFVDRNKEAGEGDPMLVEEDKIDLKMSKRMKGPASSIHDDVAKT